MRVTCRELRQSDLPSCTEIFRNAFARPPWNETWEPSIAGERLEQVFQTPGFSGVAAEASGVVGFAVGFSEPWKDGFVYYLKEACVAPSHQRQGIGTQLMAFLASQLAGKRVVKIYLLTARGDSSEAFYAKLGFYTSSKMIMMGKHLV